jgi:hypothetical protein
MYCFYCRAAVSQKLHQPNYLSTHMSFTSSGFFDWKKALRALAQHNRSRFHSECLYVVQQQSKPSVITRIDTVVRQQQEQRRRLLMVEVSSLQYRLNSVFLTHIYKEKTDSIDLKSFCSTFASKNEQRKLFFGAF